MNIRIWDPETGEMTYHTLQKIMSERTYNDEMKTYVPMLGSDMMDKMDREIYQNDMVKLDDAVYRVVFSLGSFRVGNYLLSDVHHRCQVLGNFFQKDENP